MSQSISPLSVISNKLVTDGDFEGDRIKVGPTGVVHIQVTSVDMGTTDATVTVQASLGSSGLWSNVKENGVGDDAIIPIVEESNFLIIKDLKPNSYIRTVFAANSATSGAYSIVVAN